MVPLYKISIWPMVQSTMKFAETTAPIQWWTLRRWLWTAMLKYQFPFCCTTESRDWFWNTQDGTRNIWWCQNRHKVKINYESTTYVILASQVWFELLVAGLNFLARLVMAVIMDAVLGTPLSMHVSAFAIRCYYSLNVKSSSKVAPRAKNWNNRNIS